LREKIHRDQIEFVNLFSLFKRRSMENKHKSIIIMYNVNMSQSRYVILKICVKLNFGTFYFAFTSLDVQINGRKN